VFNSIFRSDKADIYVQFTSGATNPNAPDLPCFTPRESVNGIIEITPATNIECRKLLVRLKWRTEGRGDPDQEVIGEMNAFEGTLSAGIVKSIPFRFELPRQPWSYVGKYISIVWGIEVDIDVAWKANPRHFAPLILAPAWVNESSPSSDTPRAQKWEDR